MAMRGAEEVGAGVCDDIRRVDGGWADMTAKEASPKSSTAQNPSRFIDFQPLPKFIRFGRGSGSGVRYGSGGRAPANE